MKNLQTFKYFENTTLRTVARIALNNLVKKKKKTPKKQFLFYESGS